MKTFEYNLELSHSYQTEPEFIDYKDAKSILSSIENQEHFISLEMNDFSWMTFDFFLTTKTISECFDRFIVSSIL